jgi:DNA polymerase-3 subunit alpha
MKSVGTHACGVVVSRTPLDEMVPLQRTTKDENAVMAAFEGPTLANIGLLKMDVLGLTNLSVVAEALTYIQQTTGQRIELADIPLDDKKTFDSLGRGETSSVFQMEGSGMTRYLQQLKPTRVDDLFAMVALYRPGPLEQIPVYIHNKNHPKDIKYLHPILQPILEDTYGVIVYQEQVLGILMQMAGYTMGQADIIRKAIGKKNRELMAQEEPRFKEGCVQKGLTRDQADTLWSLIQPFAGYSFNRAHSTLYGLVAYQTAWLKVNYPTQYMAAVLTAAAGAAEDVAKGVAECGRLGVAVLPADVNRSCAGFTFEHLPDGTLTEYENRLGIRFGLSAIRNVGSGPIDAIIAERQGNGPFKSIEDLADRVDRQHINKRVLESLIKCGALDGLPGSRRQKLAVLDQVVSMAADAQKTREAGQVSMFDLFGGSSGTDAGGFSVAFPIINETQADYKEQLGWEKELMGMYVSAHPVARALENVPDDPNRLTLSMLGEEHIGQKVTLIGMMTGLRRIATKKGDTMLITQVEDLDGTIEMVVFPKAYEKYSEFWKEDAIVAITAKVDNRRDTLQLVCEQIDEYTEVEAAAPVDATPVAADFADAPMPSDEDMPPPDDPAWDTVKDQAPREEPEVRRQAEENTDQESESKETMQPTMAQGSNGHNGASNGNGAAHVGNGDSPAPNVQAPTPVTIVRPRQRIEIKKKAEPQPDAPAPSGPQYTLHIHLPRTDDYVTDLRCMQEVARHLQQHRGEHKVVLHLPKEELVVLLEPMERINPAPPLVQQLTAMLGAGSIELEGVA